MFDALSTTPPLKPMHISTLTPPHLSTSFFPFNSKPKHKFPTKKPSSLTPNAALSDPFVLQIAETFEDSLSNLSSSSSTPLPLQELRDSSSQSLLSLSWPTRKDEPFRFTDISLIKSSKIQPISDPPQDFDFSSFLVDTHLPNLTIIDGFVVDSLSGLSGLPEGVFVGSLSRVSSEEILKRVFEFVENFDGDLFWSLNGVGAPDLVVVYVPEGCKVETPLHLRYCSMRGSDSGSKTMPVSNPRVLVVVEKGGEVGLVEEFVGGNGEKSYCEGASVSHSYVQTQSLGAAHIKWTNVRQDLVAFNYAQQTDAGQLTRSLLLVPQATVNVKPNLQIIADDVKCSHGAAISDLEDQLFYFQARGIDLQTARKALIFSFGAEVIDKIPFKSVRDKAKSQIAELLDPTMLQSTA